MKFQYGEEVAITKGFYKGQTGTVVSGFSFSGDSTYNIILDSVKYIKALADQANGVTLTASNIPEKDMERLYTCSVEEIIA